MRSLSAILTVAASLTVADAQVLELRVPGHSSGPVAVDAGDVIQVDVWADLDQLAVSGVGLHLSFPGQGVELLDQGQPGQEGTQPFLVGDLFPAGLVLSNRISDVPEEGRKVVSMWISPSSMAPRLSAVSPAADMWRRCS